MPTPKSEKIDLLQYGNELRRRAAELHEMMQRVNMSMHPPGSCSVCRSVRELIHEFASIIALAQSFPLVTVSKYCITKMQVAGTGQDKWFVMRHDGKRWVEMNGEGFDVYSDAIGAMNAEVAKDSLSGIQVETYDEHRR